MTFEELQERLSSGELDIPVEIDEETGEMLINMEDLDEDALAALQELLDEADIVLPSPSDMVDIHEGNELGILLDMGEADDDDLPEFDVMALMVSNMTDDKLLDYVTRLVCGGIYDMVEGDGPMALHDLGIKLRDDWDIDWSEVIATQDFEGTVKYMLGQFPASQLRPIAETAFKRAILVMLSEGNEFMNMIMAQMAAQIVISNDREADEDNPLLAL